MRWHHSSWAHVAIVTGVLFAADTVSAQPSDPVERERERTEAGHDARRGTTPKKTTPSAYRDRSGDVGPTNNDWMLNPVPWLKKKKVRIGKVKPYLAHNVAKKNCKVLRNPTIYFVKNLPSPFYGDGAFKYWAAQSFKTKVRWYVGYCRFPASTVGKLMNLEASRARADRQRYARQDRDRKLGAFWTCSKNCNYSDAERRILLSRVKVTPIGGGKCRLVGTATGRSKIPCNEANRRASWARNMIRTKGKSKPALGSIRKSDNLRKCPKGFTRRFVGLGMKHQCQTKLLGPASCAKAFRSCAARGAKVASPAGTRDLGDGWHWSISKKTNGDLRCRSKCPFTEAGIQQCDTDPKKAARWDAKGLKSNRSRFQCKADTTRCTKNYYRCWMPDDRLR